jgi:metal-dependent amidase/aminoacylase/carboxypeptidase family protein
MPVESGPHAGSVSFDKNDAATYLETLRPYADEIKDELIDVSHQIHEHPEIRFEETFASQLLTAKLEEHGFAVERGIADLPTAFIGSTYNANGAEVAPTIGVFCEYDALEGLGHGCGHNTMAASGVVAIGRVLSVTAGITGKRRDHARHAGRPCPPGDPVDQPQRRHRTDR